MNTSLLRASGIALLLLATTPAFAQEAVEDAVEDTADAVDSTVDSAVVTTTDAVENEGGFDLGWLGLLGLFGLLGLRGGRRDHVVTSTTR